jgi:hypothetical protein
MTAQIKFFRCSNLCLKWPLNVWILTVPQLDACGKWWKLWEGGPSKQVEMLVTMEQKVFRSFGAWPCKGYWYPSPSTSSRCIPDAMKWISLIHYMFPPWCTVQPQAQSNKAKQSGMNPMKPWVKINLSFFKLIIPKSQYFVTVMKYWLTQFGVQRRSRFYYIKH